MLASQYGLASPPIDSTYPDTLEYSQSSDSDSDCSSSATLASSASSTSTHASTASTLMWSAPSSQANYTAPSVTGYESDYCGGSQDTSEQNRLVTGKLFGESLRPEFGFQQTQQRSVQSPEVIHQELRKNPRRTSAASSTSRGCPPTLSRHVDRKVEFVDKLVDSATYIVEAIWPTSSVPCRAGFGTSTSVLPLRKFIEETLRRSRTSYSTLQVGLYYLILIKPHIPAHDFTMEQTDESHASRVLQCGRRMFLAALILASKWLQDRNYSARAWSKISGLKISEINENEMAFLAAVNWKLHIGEGLYNVWSDCVMRHTPSLPPSPGASASRDRYFELECIAFKKLIRGLTPKLDNLHELAPVREEQMLPARQGSGVRSILHPRTMEPAGATCRQLPGLPALGLLPTPRRTVPQSSCGFSTPAVSAASQLLGGRACSMSSALGAASASHSLERWATGSSSSRTSPQSYVPTRRSSLANTMSNASSPESMVSDSSLESRTSSASSVSLVHSAPAYMHVRRAPGDRQKLVYGQQYQSRLGSVDEMFASKANVADVVDFNNKGSSFFNERALHISSSPESSYLAVYPAKDVMLASPRMDTTYQLSDQDAAYALQELHNHRDTYEQTPKAPQTWSLPPPANSAPPKRKWTDDDSSLLQENVRHMLAAPAAAAPLEYPTPTATPCTDSYAASWGAKRPRREMYQPHLMEAYGGRPVGWKFAAAAAA